LIKTFTCQTKFFITPATNETRQDIVSLLQSEKLPVEDLPVSLANFFIAHNNGEIIAAIGLERYENYGLLRSLVVHKDFRNNNIAGKLITALEGKAKKDGVEILYLLTETAPDYFAKKGYEKISREDVPEALKQSSEFSHVCPVSAVVMKKQLL